MLERLNTSNLNLYNQMIMELKILMRKLHLNHFFLKPFRMHMHQYKEGCPNNKTILYIYI